jgi:hypothetical protein
MLEIGRHLYRLLFALSPSLASPSSLSLSSFHPLISLMQQPPPSGFVIPASTTYRALSLTHCFRYEIILSFPSFKVSYSLPPFHSHLFSLYAADTNPSLIGL